MSHTDTATTRKARPENGLTRRIATSSTGMLHDGCCGTARRARKIDAGQAIARIEAGANLHHCLDGLRFFEDEQGVWAGRA